MYQMPKTLLIFTVCNHIEATIIALDYLEDTAKKYKGLFQFDILIMDDSSSDGTSEYLKKRGYDFTHERKSDLRGKRYTRYILISRPE